MDPLSLQFAKESWLRQVEECRDLESLKRLTKILVETYFVSKQMIGDLLLEGLGRPPG